MLRPEGAERHRRPHHSRRDRRRAADRPERGGVRRAVVTLAEIGPEEWSYVALGHYHVQHEVARRAWYAGSLDYIGPNVWGELSDERGMVVAGRVGSWPISRPAT